MDGVPVPSGCRIAEEVAPARRLRQRWKRGSDCGQRLLQGDVSGGSLFGGGFRSRSLGSAGTLSTTTKLDDDDCTSPEASLVVTSNPTNVVAPRDRTRPTTPSTSTSLPVLKGRCHSNDCSAWITPRPASSGAANSLAATANSATEANEGGAAAVHRSGSSPVAATRFNALSAVTASGTGPIRQPSRRSKWRLPSTTTATYAIGTGSRRWSAFPVPMQTCSLHPQGRTATYHRQGPHAPGINGFLGGGCGSGTSGSTSVARGGPWCWSCSWW